MSTCAQVQPFPAQRGLERWAHSGARFPIWVWPVGRALRGRRGTGREMLQALGTTANLTSDSTRSALQRALPWMLSRRLSRSVPPLSGSIKSLHKTYASLPSKYKGKPSERTETHTAIPTRAKFRV